MEKRGESSQPDANSVNAPPEIRRAPDFLTVYSTSARVAYSEYDVRIFLGDVVFPDPSEKTDKEVVQERACIILPFECAQALSNALEQTLMEIDEVASNRRATE